MATRRSRESSIFGLSFLDVLATTIGGLAFLLVMAVLMTGVGLFTTPRITTRRLPDAYVGREYQTWLGARGGLGQFNWRIAGGEPPPWMVLERRSGRISGRPVPTSGMPDEKVYHFVAEVSSDAVREASVPKSAYREFELRVHRDVPVYTTPLKIVTESPLPVALLGKAYPQVLSASGGQPPYHWSGKLPEGLTLDGAGRFHGKPREEGRFPLQVTVRTRAGERASKQLMLRVTEQHPAPPPPPPLQVITERMPSAVAGRVYTFAPSAQGGTPPLRWTVQGERPTWLTGDAHARVFSGVPPPGAIGHHAMTWQVMDAAGNTASTGKMDLQVLPPTQDVPPVLRVVTDSLPDARAGQPYRVALAAVGGVPPLTWHLARAGGDADMKVTAADGMLTLDAARPGERTVRVSVTDRLGAVATAVLALHVRPAQQPLTIITRSAPGGRVGRRYELSLAATGGYSPYRWSIAGGTLPPGLKLDAMSGRIAGTPTQAGRWRARVDVSDAENASPVRGVLLQWSVLSATAAPKLRIATSVLPTLLAGEANAVTLAAKGGRAPYRWSAPVLPAGLRIVKGDLVGMPRSAGRYPLTLVLHDASGQQASRTLDLVVRRVVSLWLLAITAALLAACLLGLLVLLAMYRRRRPMPLEILSMTIPNARASSSYEVQLACAGGLPPYSWRLVDGELPDGLVLDEGGLIHGTPFAGISLDRTREFKVTVEVRDHGGRTATREL